MKKSSLTTIIPIGIVAYIYPPLCDFSVTGMSIMNNIVSSSSSTSILAFSSLSSAYLIKSSFILTFWQTSFISSSEGSTICIHVPLVYVSTLSSLFVSKFVLYSFIIL